MKESTKNILHWGVLYLISAGGILLIPNAIYWDDWILYRANPSTLLETFRQAGSMFNLAGYLHIALLEVGPWLYKVLTFALMFASGLSVNLIVKRHTSVSTEARFYLVLLFLVLPFNIARVALIDFPYTLFYFLFFLAWLLMDRFRVIALGLFFLSFNTNSLLVFYALPILDMFYRGGHLSDFRQALRFCVHRIDFMLLPFTFFFIKIFFFAPSGMYEGYNQSYSLINLVYLPVFQLYDLVKTDVSVGLALFFSLLSFFLLKNRTEAAIKKNKTPREMLVLGLVACLIGALPYWVVGLLPTFGGWSSRHQLLLPLGGALVIASIYSFGQFAGRAVYISTIIGISLAMNVSAYSALFGDWQKQKQLIRLFAESQEIKRAGLVLIEDKTEGINALNRKYRLYEWNGLLEVAFGRQTHFAIQPSEYDGYVAGKFDAYFSEENKAGLFRKDAGLPQVLVTIEVAEPERFSEKIISRFFPKLSLSVSVFNR
ncbi:MAG: hypothetical protein WCK63_05540 [Betaproteobacteria bacterium]